VKIDVFTLAYNEEVLLPYFLRHYGEFADRIVLYNNCSTDGTVAIALNHPKVEIRSFDTDNEIRDDKMQWLKNNCWKGSKADWVMIVDVDEIFWHPDIVGYLEMCLTGGVTIIKPHGFDMVSGGVPRDPVQIYDQIRWGVRNPKFDKCCVFRPDKLLGICYEPGAHTARPKGTVVYPKPNGTKLLHYRWLGLNWVLGRWYARSKRLSEINLKHRWGHEYLLTTSEITQKWHELQSQLVEVVPSVSITPGADH
jgi:glycosyltransferase involved in cell wall biosynthesis